MARFPDGSTKRAPKVSSAYGPRIGGAYSFHYGVDFIGYTKVRSVVTGRVTTVGRISAAAGLSVAVDLAGGDNGATVTVVNMHLASAAVSVGDYVREGDLIGRMGATGNATGVCDHLEIRYWRGGRMTTVNPIQWITARLPKPATATVGKNITRRSVRSIQKLVGAKQDGRYGAETTAKVKAWQKKHGLSPDGIWGPISDGIGFPKYATIRRGSRGSLVKKLQSRLRTNYRAYAGHLRSDGIFGGDTEKVVKEFQRRAGLKSDGIVGPKTWARLGF